MISPGPGPSHESVHPSWIDAKLIELTILTWSPFYGRELTRQEAIEILVNFGMLIDTFKAEES